MPAPKKWRNKIVLAKLEGSYGVDAAPTGAADGILAVEVSLTPMEGEDISRDLDLPYFGNQATVAATLHAKLKFKVELAGSGTAGTPPGYDALLRACAMAQTVNPGVSVVYNPITENPESITLYIWIDNTLYKLPGTRGTVSFSVSAQKIPYAEFDFTGLFAPVTETARDLPDLNAYQTPKIGSTLNTPVFTMDGNTLVLREFVMDVGNNVEGRFLIGAENIIITERSTTIKATIEAVPITTLNPYELAQNATPLVIALTHGINAGNIVTFNVPVAQMARPEGLENSQNIVEWPLMLNALPQSGNDEFTLTFT